MRIFYDCEFLEDGKTIDLISIGLIAEAGDEYYAVNSDMPIERIESHGWLMKNVVPHCRHHAFPPGLVKTNSSEARPPTWGIRISAKSGVSCTVRRERRVLGGPSFARLPFSSVFHARRTRRMGCGLARMSMSPT